MVAGRKFLGHGSPPSQKLEGGRCLLSFSSSLEQDTGDCPSWGLLMPVGSSNVLRGPHLPLLGPLLAVSSSVTFTCQSPVAPKGHPETSSQCLPSSAVSKKTLSLPGSQKWSGSIDSRHGQCVHVTCSSLMCPGPVFWELIFRRLSEQLEHTGTRGDQFSYLPAPPTPQATHTSHLPPHKPRSPPK